MEEIKSDSEIGGACEHGSMVAHSSLYVYLLCFCSLLLQSQESLCIRLVHDVARTIFVVVSIGALDTSQFCRPVDGNIAHGLVQMMASQPSEPKHVSR